MALALVALIGGGGAASAQGAEQQPTDVRLTVEAGYGGTYLRGRDTPVRVSIAADRLVRGTLEVTVDDTNTRYTVPVEVPGGSSKDVVVVVATPLFEVSGVDARLVGGGDAVTAEGELEQLDGADELVGLLPGVQPPELPAPQPLPVVEGAARFVALEDDLLALAPGSLGPLGTVVAGADELERLDPTARAGLLAWVARGGRLAVDAQPGAAVAGLPDEWQPGEAGRADAGRGEVALTSGAAAAGRWADVVEPTSNVAPDEFGQNSYTESVEFAVARDAGVDSLDAPWLVGFLIAYILAAGPIVWLVLRARRRPALGWVAVPAVAVIFTAGAFVVGNDLRGANRAGHASMVEMTSGGNAFVTTYVGVVSRDGDDAHVEFLPGWTAGAINQSFTGGPARAASVALTPDGPAGAIDLAPADYATLVGSGPAPFDGTLRVEATAGADGVVHGTVHNDTPYALEEVGVIAGERGTNVGALRAGDSVEFEVRPDTVRNDPSAPVAYTAWPSVFDGNFGFDPSSIANLSLHDAVALQHGPNAYGPGVVSAIGWTRGYQPPVEVSGQSDPEGRTGISATALIQAEPGTIPAATVRRVMVRGGDGTELPEGEGIPRGVRGGTWRFDLPAEADPGTALELLVPQWLTRADVWDGTTWVAVVDRLDGENGGQFIGDPFATDAVALPAGTAAGGVVWVRGWLGEDFFTNGSGLMLQAATEAVG